MKKIKFKLFLYPPQDFWSSDMNKMKNFKRRFSLSVPRTETIEENEFTEQINQLNIHCNDGTVFLLNLYISHSKLKSPDVSITKPSEINLDLNI